MATETSTLNTFRHFIIIISISIGAYLYYSKVSNTERQRVLNVLAGLIAEEKSINLTTDLPIAVGFGSCVDIFTKGILLVDALGLKPPAEPKYHQSINKLQDVADMFALYLSKGAAVERYIPNDLMKTLVKTTETIEGAHWVVGGNAPVLSSRFARSGFKVYLGAKGSKKFRDTYHENIEFSEGFGDEDDIHLVMEFSVGEKWGNYTVTRANRFILHSDKNNPEIHSLESFQGIVDRVQPRLIVIGGLQMLDNVKFEEGVRQARMEKLKKWLMTIPKTTLIHFEMASFAELEMMQSLQENVFPYIDSLGMNEQELPNVNSIATSNKIIEIADSNPRTATVLDDIRQLIAQFKSTSKRGLSRVHVHTLSYQTIWTERGSNWKNPRAGCAKASLIAHRHVCGVDKINADNAKLLMDDSFSLTAKNASKRINFNEYSPISCWNEDGNEICIAPVLVCTKVKQTAGGGDNITPGGLMPQL